MPKPELLVWAPRWETDPGKSSSEAVLEDVAMNALSVLARHF